MCIESTLYIGIIQIPMHTFQGMYDNWRLAHGSLDRGNRSRASAVTPRIGIGGPGRSLVALRAAPPASEHQKISWCFYRS